MDLSFVLNFLFFSKIHLLSTLRSTER
uniref:Uncharacterized protein n=1 Tax=Rhizophora mucronata TaxID=61149 RepID=A0A2P2KK94_RHIMU